MILPILFQIQIKHSILLFYFANIAGLKVGIIHELSLFSINFSYEMPTLNLYISKSKGPMPKIQIDHKRWL
jgi:hypothetical protein